MSQEVREEVLKLMDQKDKIEKEITALTEILTLNGVGMNEPLVDPEGFPLNSVDVYQVRHARQKIIMLQNDHKNLMKQIENGLTGYYSATANNPIQNDASMQHRPEITVYKTPFAKVNIVSNGSPAEYAGLFVNDEIVEFGSINNTNFKALTDIANVVQHSEGSPICLKIKRQERFLTVQLIPKKWHGKGLLGCNIIPV